MSAKERCVHRSKTCQTLKLKTQEGHEMQWPKEKGQTKNNDLQDTSQKAND
jgi:hypothetical protein